MIPPTVVSEYDGRLGTLGAVAIRLHPVARSLQRLVDPEPYTTRELTALAVHVLMRRAEWTR